MEVVRYFTSNQKQPPATGPKDSIVQLPDIPPVYECNVEVALRFDSVLDPEKLQQSLKRLLEIGNWRQLGGRLRRRDTNSDACGYDLHVPVEFTTERPAFIYKTLESPAAVDEHPVACKMPQPTDPNKILFYNVRDALTPSMTRTHHPRKAQEWAESDLPPLSFEQLNFRDGTIILLLFPHILMDATGYGLFLKAWTCVLQGRMDDVPQCCGFSESITDMLCHKTPAESFTWHNHLLKGLDRLRFTARLLWENICGKEERIIRVPGKFITQTRDKTLADLSTSQDSPFVSHSDVLVAWFVRVVLASLNPQHQRTLVLTNAFDIRHMLPPERAYLQNSVFLAHTMLPVGEVVSNPASFLANEIRRSLVRERTEEQVQARCAWAKDVGIMPLLGSSDMLLCNVSNWSKGGLLDLDFGPAAITQRPGPCVPSSILNCSQMRGVTPEYGIILGKDSQDGWWMQWRLSKFCWAMIERELDTINQTR
ncbi:O-acB [Aspergillus calidoustus]|uniref:O-acyltransferase ausP n=1 Tax=Aspergillus calidoustus TaxID=454130 RepID=AUSP_ASPCI|nr:RecName: Full=O-acyltransferase ausP; AltName: Full=Austinoid biosynthesis cluster protein P [Aspergillus calidoustus]CEL11255.1 O-acB [Aspergillus calidoustus]